MPKRRTARTKTKRATKKTKRSHKLLVSALIIVLSGLALSIYGVVNYVKKDVALAFTTDDASFIESEFPILVYLVSSDLTSDPIILKEANVYILDTKSKKLINYSIPVDLTFDVPGKYSVESVSKILALGNLENSNNMIEGFELIERSTLKLTGVRPHKYLLIDDALTESISNFLETGDLLSLLLIKDYKNNLVTNLSIKDGLYISDFVQSLPEGRILTKKFDSTWVNNSEGFDDELLDITFESKISSEQKNISILNGSNVQGLAGFGSRIVKNMGGRVVGVSNASKQYEESFIIADDLDSYTVSYLSNTLEIKNIVLKNSSDAKLNESAVDRSDVVVVVGLDIANKLY